MCCLTITQAEAEMVKEEEGETAGDTLTAYELERQARIARNNERLAALNLPTLANAFMATVAKPAAPARPRGLAAKKTKKVTTTSLAYQI